MNNFKKILSLFFVVLFAFTLVACGPSGEVKAKLEEQADKIYLGDLSEVTNDLKLPKYAFGDKAFTIEWASDNEEVIEIKELDELYYLGFVTMQNDVTVVKLTATVTYEKATTTREFEVKVLADEYVGYENIAAVKAQEGKEKDVSKVKFSGTVCFTTGSGFGVYDGSAAMYCYGSNHGRTVGEKVEVRGVWTFYNNMVQLKESNVKVLGTDDAFNIEGIAEEKSIAEIAALEAKTVDPENSTKIFRTKFAAKENATGSYNTYKLVDPLDSNKIVDVSKYNDADTLTYVGELAASGKFYEGIVIIYCSRSGTNGLWDVLLVPSTVKEVEITLTDDQKADSVIAELQDKFNGKKVKEALELPTTGANGATISWASDNEAVISATGAFVAPVADTEVKLTATVKVGSATKTVEITVTAKAAAESVATLVNNPEVGVAYKLGIEQTSLEKNLFFTGEMNGYYGATVEEHTGGVDMFLEATEGGYNLYFMAGEAKKYITIVISGKYKNFTIADAPANVWTFDATNNTLVSELEGTTYYLGTYGTYNTVSVSSIDKIATSFPARFYKVEAKSYFTKTPAVETAYKLGIDQAGLEKNLFFTGEMNGYYGATAESYASGVDMFLEATEGGYNLYFMAGEAKKYITIVISGKYKNFTIADAPANVWTFDATNNTLVSELEGTTYYLGTYGTYNTVSVSSIDKIETSYPARLYVADPATSGSGSAAGTIAGILEEAADLEHDTTLEGEYTVTGTITEVTDPYNEQYKNVSFKLSDGTAEILCFRVKGDVAATIKATDKVTVTGQIKNYNGTIEFVNATVVLVEAGNGQVSGGGETSTEKGDATIEFSDVANRTQFNDDIQVWEQNGIKVTNNKNESKSKVADYSNPARFYASSNLVIEYSSNIAKIVITTAGGKNMAADQTVEGATMTIDGTTVVITLDTPATSFTIDKLVAQIRVAKIDIFIAK